MVEKFAKEMLNVLKIEKKAQFHKKRYSNCTEVKIWKKKINSWSGCVITFEFFKPQSCGVFLKNSSVKLFAENITTIGTVEETKGKYIVIAFNPPMLGMKLSFETTFKILPHVSDVVFERMMNAMYTLRSYRRNPPNQIIEICFNGERYYDKVHPKVKSSKESSVDLFNTNLNDCQQKAVKLALDEPEVAIIHGPPGTGKTTTVVETILQLVKRKLKILVCTPSNAALDNILMKLMEAKKEFTLPVHKEWMLRYGHPSKVHPDCHYHSFDEVLKRHKNFEIIKLLEVQISMLKSEEDSKTITKLWKKIQRLIKFAILDSFKKANIVLTTLTSVSEKSEHFRSVCFDLVIIDECSQGLEAAAWLVLLKVNKCILAGDHQQLPPTVISNNSCVMGCLKVSLMERLLKFLEREKVIMLKCQYRMHKLIQEWPSKQFYDNALYPHHSIATHLLSDLEGVTINDITTSPLLLIDTAGLNKRIENTIKQCQLYNKLEAHIVYSHVYKLIEQGVKPENISVISPYALQVKVLQIVLKSVAKVEVSSIDSFQGRENEVIILSLVRSNIRGKIGFLSDLRRLNVAVTRAKRHLTVICDTKTVKSLGIIAHMQKVGFVIPAKEYTLLDSPLENEAFKSLVQQSRSNKGPSRSHRRDIKDRVSKTDKMENLAKSFTKNCVIGSSKRIK